MREWQEAGQGSISDKTGRLIARGDVLKVYHFTGARRKRYFMFKQALGFVTRSGGSGAVFLKFGHLDLSDEYYLEHCDGRTLPDYEIVQSIDAKFEDRPRAALSASDKTKE